MKRKELLELVRDEPEDIDINRLLYRLYVRRQIELGLAAADVGDVLSEEEFEQLSETWLA